MHLDHASLRVADVAAGQAYLLEPLGFRSTETAQAAGQHARVFLDRGYLEVSAGSGLYQVGEGQPLLTGWPGFFLRTASPAALVARAKESGLSLHSPAVYTGHDGQWLDVTFDAPKLQSLLPAIVKRISPEDIAASWPPRLTLRHPNGARTLKSVYLLARDRERAGDVARSLRALPGVAAQGIDALPMPFIQASVMTVPLAGGGQIFACYPAGPGTAGEWLEEMGEGVFSVSFGVEDLLAAESTFRKNGLSVTRDPGAGETAGPAIWLPPQGKLGVYLRFEGE